MKVPLKKVFVATLEMFLCSPACGREGSISV